MNIPVFCIERYPHTGGCRPGGAPFPVWCGEKRWPSRYMSLRAARSRVKQFPSGVCSKCLVAQLVTDEGWCPIATAPKLRRLIWLMIPWREPSLAYSDTFWRAGFSVENTPILWRPAYEDEADVDGSSLHGRPGAWAR